MTWNDLWHEMTWNDLWHEMTWNDKHVPTKFLHSSHLSMWLAGASEHTAARAAIARHRKTLLPPQDWEKLLGVGKQLPNAKRPNEITSQYCNWLTLEHCTCDTSHADLNFLSLKTLQLSSRQNPGQFVCNAHIMQAVSSAPRCSCSSAVAWRFGSCSIPRAFPNRWRGLNDFCWHEKKT